MPLKIDENILEFEYTDDTNQYDIDTFFTIYGDKKFDINSKKQMLIMLQEISDKLNLEDEYSIKRLETVLHYELPFFAINRKLIRSWLLQNFIY